MAMGTAIAAIGGLLLLFVAFVTSDCPIPQVSNGVLQALERDVDGQLVLGPLDPVQGPTSVAGSVVVILTCSEGYSLTDGANQAVCPSSNGRSALTPTLGRCVRDTSVPRNPYGCVVPSVSNGYFIDVDNRILRSDSFVIGGETILLICLQDFNPVGERSSFCLNTGKWSPPITSSCSRSTGSSRSGQNRAAPSFNVVNTNSYRPEPAPAPLAPVRRLQPPPPPPPETETEVESEQQGDGGGINVGALVGSLVAIVIVTLVVALIIAYCVPC